MSEQLQTEPIVTVRRFFPFSRQKVFKAWTTPQALESWFKPFGLSIRVRNFDLRVGGSFKFEYQQSSHLSTFVTGTYLEIVEPEKLVFTWSSQTVENTETLVVIQLKEVANGTELVLTHSGFLNAVMAEKHSLGWESILEILELFLA